MCVRTHLYMRVCVLSYLALADSALEKLLVNHALDAFGRIRKVQHLGHIFFSLWKGGAAPKKGKQKGRCISAKTNKNLK